MGTSKTCVSPATVAMPTLRGDGSQVTVWIAPRHRVTVDAASTCSLVDPPWGGSTYLHLCVLRPVNFRRERPLSRFTCERPATSSERLLQDQELVDWGATQIFGQHPKTPMAQDIAVARVFSNYDRHTWLLTTPFAPHRNPPRADPHNQHVPAISGLQASSGHPCTLLGLAWAI